VRAQIGVSTVNVGNVGVASAEGQSALGDLVDGLEAAIGSVEQINAEMLAHARAVDEVLDAMGQVRGITEETRDRISRVAEAAEQQSFAIAEVTETSQFLAEAAQRLTSLADRFQVGAQQVDGPAPDLPPAPPAVALEPPSTVRRHRRARIPAGR
jgi:methyl-accepting chemotaxis protein